MKIIPPKLSLVKFIGLPFQEQIILHQKFMLIVIIWMVVRKLVPTLKLLFR